MTSPATAGRSAIPFRGIATRNGGCVCHPDGLVAAINPPDNINRNEIMIAISIVIASSAVVAPHILAARRTAERERKMKWSLDIWTPGELSRGKKRDGRQALIESLIILPFAAALVALSIYQ